MSRQHWHAVLGHAILPHTCQQLLKLLLSDRQRVSRVQGELPVMEGVGHQDTDCTGCNKSSTGHRDTLWHSTA